MPAREGFRPPTQGIVFLAVPDGAVGETAASIASLEPSRRVSFLHVSGAHRLDALDALRDHAIGSFHPLQSFPEPRPPEAFRGITIAIDASTPSLLRRLRSLARSIGARPKRVGDAERVLYHASAVFASNFLDVVVWEAVRLLRQIGWTEAEATKALLPLVEGAVANIRRRGPVRALTGPIRRGDAETVSRHLAALAKLGPAPPSGSAGHLPMNGEETYRMLALVALEIAQEAGLDPAAAERTKRALTRDVAATQRRGRR